MARGEEAAWEKFHHRFFERLLRYAIVLHRGDETNAADVVQQSLLRVVRHIRRFEEEAVFWSWLTCLTRCAAADAGRKRSRRLHFMECFTHWQEARTAPDAHGTVALGVLESSLDELSFTDRALIEGKYFDALSYAELAEEFNLTAKAVESRLSRLRVKLRKSITSKIDV